MALGLCCGLTFSLPAPFRRDFGGLDRVGMMTGFDGMAAGAEQSLFGFLCRELLAEASTFLGVAFKRMVRGPLFSLSEEELLLEAE